MNPFAPSEHSLSETWSLPRGGVGGRFLGCTTTFQAGCDVAQCCSGRGSKEGLGTTVSPVSPVYTFGVKVTLSPTTHRKLRKF